LDKEPYAEFIKIDTESIFDQKPNLGRFDRDESFPAA